MPPIPENPNVRKGQFLWKEENEQRSYVEELVKKITSGYYFSEKILGDIVDELAPVFVEDVQ